MAAAVYRSAVVAVATVVVAQAGALIVLPSS